MIQTFEDVDRLAAERGPKRLAVLAPEDEEFMSAVKQCWQRGLVTPVLIGNRDVMAAIADRVGFDLSDIEQITMEDRQAIADLGTAMLFAGDVDMESKGQIPTSYIYRSIIREESKAKTGRTVSVISLWDVPGAKHFIALTDTGVNIQPDYTAKKEIIKNAVFLFHILGYKRPRIGIISARRSLNRFPDSYRDALALKEAADSGDFGACDIVDATSLFDFFMNHTDSVTHDDGINIDCLPEILLVPNLDTGNILVKLDFFLDVKRRSLVTTSKGPAIIPSRSDFCNAIVGELALGIVVADRMMH